jgi:hypothetical protein
MEGITMRAAKLDNPQRPLISLLNSYGATFQSTAAVGNGCPDGFVGFLFLTDPVEFKTPGASKHKGPEERQAAWRQRWNGSPCWVLRTPNDVVAMLANMRERARKLGGS